MYRTGQNPGKGRYVCEKCGRPLYLEDEYDTFPTCPSCQNREFTDGNVTYEKLPICLTFLNQE